MHPQDAEKICLGVIYRGKLLVHPRQSHSQISEDIFAGREDLEGGSG